MAKKKIKIDLSGGWRDVLEQAIDVNDVYAIESDLEDETAMEITDRNFIVFFKIIHYIREDDAILFSPSEIRVLLGILMEDFVHLQNDLTNEFKKLYFMRWGVETAFDTLKNKLLIEKFAGRSPIAVMQEFYAMMFILNCLAAMKLTVDRKLKAVKSDCKYSYQGNLNLMIGYFKYRIPMMILSSHLIISTAKILICLCMRQPVQIISDRS